MLKETLRLFNKALPVKNPLPFKEVNEFTIKHGYLVQAEICSLDILQWVTNEKRDYNSTFYKQWNDVLSKNRFELMTDQLMHYASTYGTGFQGEVYLPEGKVETPELKNLKVIGVIIKEDLIKKCEDLLFSGIALKQDTINDVLVILKGLQHTIDIEKVRNKEAKMLLCKELNILPKEPVEMVRFLTYLVTGKTLLIKNKEVFIQLQSSHIEIETFVKMFGYEKLSSVFYRFKPIFLALRSNKSHNRECVNKLRRLATVNHKPLKANYFADIITTYTKANEEELKLKLKEITNFKKISLLQTINVRLKALDTRAFVVRNQKLFIKEDIADVSKDYLSLYNIIYQDLVNSLKDKATTVKIPKGVNITLPTSEKSFIGNYPLGTNFDFSNSDNIVGINWRGNDGANDLDLSLISIDGTKYGWNAAYKNDRNSVVFSGDMTSAYPEATELFYASKNFSPSLVRVNLFSGIANSKFRFFLAKEKVKDMKRNYMVDPNNIIVNVECEMDSKEKILGVITDNKFILTQFRSGKGRVSYQSITDKYTNYALATLDCYLSLEDLLKKAGYKIINSGNAEIDLTDLSKETLIKLIK